MTTEESFDDLVWRGVADSRPAYDEHTTRRGVPMERSDGTRLVECAIDAWAEYAASQWATDVGYAPVLQVWPHTA